MDLQSLNANGCLMKKEHKLPDILERLVASLVTSTGSCLQNKTPIKDVQVPEIDVNNTADLIEGYRMKFQSIEQNLKDEFMQVCHFLFGYLCI